MMECPSCGQDNIPGADHCSRCGADLHDLDRQRPAEGLLADLTSAKLSRLIPRTPVQVGPETLVRDAIKILVETGRNCALVVSGEAIVGILTERDILRKVGLDYKTLAERPVSEFMTPDPEVLGTEDTIAFGLNRMTTGDFRHIPIAREGKPLGVVSVRDVLSYMVDRYPKELGTDN
ncbi:MAG: CBS domain-containing protein [Planctomycetota bacterium]|jgi:CBS domain-containing protein